MSSVYSDIGLSTTESRQTAVQQAAKTGSSKISQEDFLKMLTTELSYQDPTNPSDNNQMVAQLSQLSMVDGINSLNSTVTDLQGSVASGESQSIPTNTYGRVSSVVLGNGTEETRLNILGRDDTIGLADILQVAGG